MPDKQGCYRPEDAKEILKQLKAKGAITFSYSRDSQSAYTVTLADSTQLGILHTGQKVEGRTIVAVHQIGAFHFDLNLQTELHHNYIAEKLGLKQDSDSAYDITALLNAIRLLNQKKEKPE